MIEAVLIVAIGAVVAVLVGCVSLVRMSIDFVGKVDDVEEGLFEEVDGKKEESEDEG